MPEKEIPLQYDFFSGELVDNRTRKQKRADRQANGDQQIEMFTQRDLAQFGVRSRSEMALLTAKGTPVAMALEMEDPRTEEQKELDRQKAAEDLTNPLPELEPAQPE